MVVGGEEAGSDVIAVFGGAIEGEVDFPVFVGFLEGAHFFADNS